MTHRLFVVLAALAFLCIAAPAGAQATDAAVPGAKRILEKPLSDAPSYAKYALVIGVTDYDSCNPLHVCNSDAADFADLLRTKFGFTGVVLMSDAAGTAQGMRPTQRHIERALETLYTGIEPDKSQVVLFFSGHGVRAADADWLVPEDGDPNDVPGSCINFDAIKQRLATLRPARVLLVTDACRSLLGGKAAGTSSGFGKDLYLTPLGPEVADLQSCQPTEISQEGLPEDFSESVFTHFLIQGLKGAPDAVDADTHNVTFDSLKQYVQGSVHQYVASHFNNASQTPDGSATLGRMVLAGPAEAVQPPTPITPVPIVVPPVVVAPPAVTTPAAAGSVRVNPKDGAEMVFVPAGPFPMGDSEHIDNPPHTVTLSGYWIYKNDVTVAMYRKFCDATGRQMPPAPFWGWKEDNPVVDVKWDDAVYYCGWAGGHVPTEAQWEKAARGTDGRKYPWGNEFDASRLWMSRNQQNDAGGTAPAGSYPSGASPYGALDMAGNVWQWCGDLYDTDYWRTDYGADPTGPAFRLNRVVRGGSWPYADPKEFRSSLRFFFVPSLYSSNVGFRVVVAE